MNHAIKSIGIIIALFAILYMAKPSVMISVLEFFKKGKRLYLAGILRFVLAIIFLLGANRCHYPVVIAVFGIMFIIGGLLIFVMKLEKLKSILDWWQKQSIVLLRVLAIITFTIGAVIVYSA
jgi:hypothetical protein